MIYEEFQARVRAIPFPDKKAIKEEVFKGFDDFVGTKSDIDARQSELEEQAKQSYREARRKHGEAVNAVYKDFQDALSKEYGTENKEIDDRVWRKAWDDGHSNGLHEVEVHYDELSELAQFVYDKAMASK